MGTVLLAPCLSGNNLATALELAMAAPWKIFRRTFTITSMRAKLADLLGRTVAGLDRLTPRTFEPQSSEHFRIAKRKCVAGTYRFTPYVERLVSKGRDKKPRLISIATTRDRIVLDLLKDCLHEIYPDCVARRLPNQTIRDVKRALEDSEASTLYYGRFDIKNFYPSIVHHRLFETLGQRIRSKKILCLVARAIRNPTVQLNSRKHERRVAPICKGVPQGLPISNILAEIYLREVDRLSTGSACCWRYADDFLVLGTESAVREYEKNLGRVLCRAGLHLNRDKWEIQSIKEGLAFLGYRFQHGEVSVRKPTVDRFLSSIAGLVTFYVRRLESKQSDHLEWKKHEGRLKSALVEELNERVAGAISENRRYGWIFYFLEITDMTLLHEMDHAIHSILARHSRTLTLQGEKIKRLVRAHHEAKHRPLGGYSLNYDELVTIEEKWRYLVRRAYVRRDHRDRYSDEEVENLFERKKNDSLLRLDRDTGTFS